MEESKPPELQQDDEKFIPRGAIAFFILLVILGMIIWFGAYYLLIIRA